jgi:galactokinase
LPAESTKNATHLASAEARQEFVAPARVNLLGEHTDYTGGLVLPMAIPFQTVASIAPRDDAQYRFLSDRFAEVRTMTREDRSASVGAWSDYPAGVLRQLQALGIEPAGFDLHLRGDVPLGAGLSSSASVEVASAIAILAHAAKTLPPEEIALLCQRAENDYVHSPCGIMDQFVITTAKAGHALLLHTRTLAYEHIPMNSAALAGTCVVVCNSMVKHSIASGEYGDRRREVEIGQDAIRAAFPNVLDLGESNMEQLDACAGNIPHESYLRCRHILNENARVREARQVMLAGDAVRLGELMVKAHASQRDDFACSCEEIDFLVDTAVSLPGCFGARMTGGGFGGCTVNLVTREQAESFSNSLKNIYRERFSIDADIYICEAVDGAIARNAGRELHA